MCTTHNYCGVGDRTQGFRLDRQVPGQLSYFPQFQRMGSEYISRGQRDRVVTKVCFAVLTCLGFFLLVDRHLQSSLFTNLFLNNCDDKIAGYKLNYIS